jgi:hypothetical protein
LKPAFLAVIAASVFNRSRVDRASRSSRVTVRTVARLKAVEQAAKLRPVGLCAARDFAEHLFASSPVELAHLGVNALAVGGHSRITVFHALTYDGNLCKGKVVLDQGGNFFCIILGRKTKDFRSYRQL